MDSNKVQYFLTRLDEKMKMMKDVTVKQLKQEQQSVLMNDTQEGFVRLMKARKGVAGAQNRLRGIYSFDIKDNPTFKKTQKTEKRVRKLMGMA